MSYFITLSIIILTKDRFELIDNCLHSLVATCNFPDIELIIGDTGSQDNQVFELYDIIGSKWKGQFRMKNLPSYHFSKNNNELATDAQGTYLLFLNNDTAAVSTDWITKLINAFSDHPQVGIVGAKLLFAHTQRIQHAGIEFIKDGPLRYLGYHPYRNRHPLMPEVCLPKYMPAVTGAFLGISRQFFMDLGGFSEKYDQEAQDVDLCMKAQQHGKKCLYQPEITFFHLENGTRVLGEENAYDRYIFQKKWRDFIHDSFFSDRFQSLLAENKSQAARKSQPLILINRRIARGDVLAAAALVLFYRKSNPHSHISFKTSYPELVDSCPFIDRVLHTNDIDDFPYDKKISLEYEGGNWRRHTGTWLEEMGRSFFAADASFDILTLKQLLKNGSFEYPVPQYNKLEAYSANYYAQFFSPLKSIAISTGAGWPEREWTPTGWDRLTALLTNDGYRVVQIGGGNDYRVSGALHLMNRSLQDNYSILKNMAAFITLDSYPLHIGITARIPIIVLTCKTCANTVYLPKRVRELRHHLAKTTPLPGCRFLGCRLKHGTGQENSCSSPILQQLSAEKVMREINFILGKK